MIRSVALALALLLSAGAAGAQNVGPPPSGSAGTVTSVATGAGLTGGTITASGTLDLASVTAHDVMVGTGSAGAPTAVAPGTSGNVLTSNGATNDPSFQALPAFGATVLITETVTTGSAASVTFSSIPATYRDLVVRVRGRCTASATGESLLMQVNADTNADYEFQNFYAYGGSPTYAENTGQTSWHAGDIACASATANWEVVLADHDLRLSRNHVLQVVRLNLRQQYEHERELHRRREHGRPLGEHFGNHERRSLSSVRQFREWDSREPLRIILGSQRGFGASASASAQRRHYRLFDELVDHRAQRHAGGHWAQNHDGQWQARADQKDRSE